MAVVKDYRIALAGGRRVRVRTTTADTAEGAMAGAAESAGAFAGAVESTGADGVTYALNSATEYEAVIVGDFPGTHGLHVDHSHPPRWFGGPDIVAVQDGAWDDNDTWDLGRPPAAGEIVHVPQKLTFQTGADRKLVTQLFVINDGGEVVGDFSAVTETLEIVGADVAINTTLDYGQFGNGLLVLGTGKCTLKGKPKTTWGRLAAEVAAGATTVTLAEAPTNWAAGDRIVLQDSRQVKWSLVQPEWEPGHLDNHQYEERVIDSVAGAVVTVTAAFTHAHGGAKDRDGVITFYPKVMNLTRNVKIYSEDPAGARWHLLSHGRCAVDVRHCEIRDTGRSQQAPFNNFSGTTAGSNQQGRYGGWHFHHTIGPAGLDAGTPQFRFEGNACWNQTGIGVTPPRWGITLHGSHYGLVKDNVLFNWTGSGLVQEDGSETENLVEANCVFLVPQTGTGENSRSPNDIAHAGQGFWAGAGESRWVNNFASGCDTGFAVVPYMSADNANVRRPAYKGADPYSGDPADYIVTDIQARPLRQFEGNEVGGHVDIGMTLWKVFSYGTTGNPAATESVVLNHKSWHTAHSVYYNYMTTHVTFDGLVARSDFAKLRAGGGGGICFFASDYIQEDFLVTDSDIQGFSQGWLVNFGFVMAATNTVWCNFADIVLKPTWSTGIAAADMPTRQLTLTNCTFLDPTCPAFDHYGVIARSGIVMDGRVPAYNVNLIHDDEVYSYAHNGTANDYRVLYDAQLSAAVLEQTVPGGGLGPYVLGCPDAGLTNAEALAEHGVCHSNYIPSAPATLAGVYGKVEAI